MEHIVALSGAGFREAVAQAAHGPERDAALLELLQEEHPAYSQCSAAEVTRRRGWVLVELGKAPLPASAIPFVLEELETGHAPYLLAAAARALRKAPEPSPAFAPLVVRALEALGRRDDLVDLNRWGGIAAEDDAPSALDELLVTLEWMGVQLAPVRGSLRGVVEMGNFSDTHTHTLSRLIGKLDATGQEDASACCAVPASWRRWMPGFRDAAQVTGVRFEDHDAVERSWADAFHGHPTIVAFFYTRCDNELKCSLTVSKLAQVQKHLAAAGLRDEVGIAAITYDPAFDLPHRLRGYALSRGLETGDGCRLLRVTTGDRALKHYFSSGVNFTGSIVNRHRIEVFVLDAEGQIAATFQRLAWEPSEVVAEAKSQLRSASHATAAEHPTAASTGLARKGAAMAPTLWALGLALLPKCPICGATYLSMTGIAALPQLQGFSQYWPVLLLLLLINTAAVAWMARANRRWSPFWFAATGTVLLVWPGLALGYDSAMTLGAIAIALGSLLALKGFNWASGPAVSDPVSTPGAPAHSAG